MSEQMFPTREELELDQVRADIALKRVQGQWEPWKAMTAAFGAGAALATAMLALAVYVVAHLH